jgi:hypothetical protein
MAVMDATNAFMRPEIADAEGIRLRLPTEQQLRAAEESAHTIQADSDNVKRAVEEIRDGHDEEPDRESSLSSREEHQPNPPSRRARSW